MALTASLVERTPDVLRYLVTSDGQATASPDSVVIPNAAGATPDLRTDAGGAAGWAGSALDDLVSTAAATQAAARTLLDGIGLTTAGAPGTTNLDTARGRLSVRARNSLGDQHWGVDANEGAAAGDAPSAGFAVLVVTGPNIADAAAIVSLENVHSYAR